jgi:hypothetical protein
MYALMCCELVGCMKSGREEGPAAILSRIQLRLPTRHPSMCSSQLRRRLHYIATHGQ